MELYKIKDAIVSLLLIVSMYMILTYKRYFPMFLVFVSICMNIFLSVKGVGDENIRRFKDIQNAFD